MARVTLRITGTQLLCQDEHPSLLAALESHNVAVEYCLLYTSDAADDAPRV